MYIYPIKGKEMKNEWIPTSILYPPDGQKVKMKVYDQKMQNTHELNAIYHEDELSRRWEFTMPDGADIIHLPTHWKSDEE